MVCHSKLQRYIIEVKHGGIRDFSSPEGSGYDTSRVVVKETLTGYSWEWPFADPPDKSFIYLSSSHVRTLSHEIDVYSKKKEKMINK